MKLLIALLVLFSFIFGAMSALFGGEIALLLFALVFPVVFILVDYRVGVVLSVIALPISTFKVFSHLPGLNLANVLVLAACGAFFLRRLLKPGEFVKMPPIIWWRYIIPIFVAVGVGVIHVRGLSMRTALDMGAGFASIPAYIIGYGIKPMLLIVAAWTLGNAVRDSKNQERFLIPIVLSIVLPALILLFYIMRSGQGLKVLSSQAARGFLTSLGMHANEFGAMFAIGFAILIFMIPAVSTIRARVLLIASASIVLVALALTFSRGGYIAIIVSGAYFVISQKRVRLALVSFAVALLLIAVTPQTIVDRALVGFGGAGAHDVLSSRVQDDELTAGRFWLWRQTFPSFYKSPLIGSGIASQAWSDAAKTGVIHTIQTHNLYLSILYDVGIIGFALVISFFVFLYRNFKSVARKVEVPPAMAGAFNGVAAGMLGMAVMGFTNGLFFPQIFQIYIWLMFGLSIAYMSDAEKLESKKIRFWFQPLRKKGKFAQT